MSFPNIPSVNPDINITVEDTIKLLLASIAFEEIGLANIINAEAEKIQYVLGTIPGQAKSVPPSFDEITSVDKTVERILRTIIKNQMLLQFKLEDVLDVFTSSTTTTSCSTTTTTTTSTCTTTSSTTCSSTTTAQKPCVPDLPYAVFANNNLCIASQSLINANTQVNGSLTVTHNGNNFLGNTKVAGEFTDYGGNFYQDLHFSGVRVPQVTFTASSLVANADLIINKDVLITCPADTAQFQGKTVWVKGSVKIIGNNITITGGGILANGGINITGCNFAYNSTGCFALYSRTGNIRIAEGPYRINGLVYTTHEGDIRLTCSQGGTICGALISGRDIVLDGGDAVHHITNKCSCNSFNIHSTL